MRIIGVIWLRDMVENWHLSIKVNLRKLRRFSRIARESDIFALMPKLAQRVVKEARKQGVSGETLVNLWLGEKLREVMA